MKNVIEKEDYDTEDTVFQGDIPQDVQLCEDYRHEVSRRLTLEGPQLEFLGVFTSFPKLIKKPYEKGILW